VRPIAIITSERIWQQLEPLLEMHDAAKRVGRPREILAKDIVQLSRAYATALDREARAS
jgi:hypothetical protein